MNTKSGFESVKQFFEKIGKRNLVIAGAVALIVTAVAVNWIIFRDDEGGDGFQYDASAGMSTDYGTTLNTGTVGDETSKPTGSTTNSGDDYFSTVEVSRQRARDEALEVLQGVVENESADEATKTQALLEIAELAKAMEAEANIETMILAKGFEQCVAVINGDTCSVVVNGTELQENQISQINEIVYEQTGITPANIRIVTK